MQIFIEEVNVPINCFNYGQSLPKEEHLCRFHVKRASLVTFEVLILALFLERT